MIRNQPAKYASETSIFTGLTTNSGLEVNGMRVDKNVTQNEYNNLLNILKSKTSYEEIGLRLLAQHLQLSKPQKEIISADAFDDLQKSIPKNVKKLVVKGNEEKTYENLKNYLSPNDKNVLYNLINYYNPYYSINTLSTIKVELINSSDIIQLSYESTDAGICYNTLKIAAKVFIGNYAELKMNQKSSAVNYFQGKLDEISTKLNDAEDNLLKFNTTNDLINYDEQTKQITTQNSAIEIQLQNEKMKFESSQAVLKLLETQISKRYSINLRNVEILNIRQKMVNCNTEIAQIENRKIDNSADNSLNTLYKTKSTLEKKLENCIDSIYHFNSNSQGIEAKTLLGNWLVGVKDLETTTTMYKSMQIRQVEFKKQYKLYAPLGSTFKRIERRISVIESEYLDVLKNLNTALQNEHNTELTSNMRLIDEAEFPVASLPSKKTTYVLLSVLVTLILYILGIFTIELMDHRIKTPGNIIKLTGIEFLGAFCISNIKKFPGTESMEQKAATYILEKIKMLLNKSEKTIIIQILSIWDDSGQLVIADNLQRKLEQQGLSVKIFDFMTAYSDKSDDENFKNMLNNYCKAKQYTDLLEGTDEKIDCLISIIPPINHGIQNPMLIQKADISLIAYNANFAWSKADDFHTNKIKQLITNNLYTILTNTILTDLEEVYGEIEKNRSKVRKLIKTVLKRITNT